MQYSCLMPDNDFYEAHLNTVAQFSQLAFKGQLNITPHLLKMQTRPCNGLQQAIKLAWSNGHVVGIVIVSAMTNMAQLDPALNGAAPLGWVDFIAVDPAHQRQGHGSTLLNWAISWLKDHGCEKVWLGAGIRTFMPGYPANMGDDTFFTRRGFVTSDRLCWDVACDLSTAAASSFAIPAAASQAIICPLTPAEIPDLLAFFRREFPGRWRNEFEQFIADGGRPSDYTILRLAGEVHGFCQLTFEDSTRPLERYHMQSLPRPWGQLGAIGVSAGVRGQQLGRAMLAGGLTRLRETGVRGCVIDWTDLTDFYAKFNFKLFRRYLMMQRVLS